MELFMSMFARQLHCSYTHHSILFLEFAKCYASAENPQVCVPQKADYLECLHHTKEVRSGSRTFTINQRADSTNARNCYCYSSLLAILQIKRAQTIKSHYLQSEHKRLAQKKQEAEEKAASPGGIMGLNLIGYGEDQETPSQGVKQPTQDSKASEKAPKEAVKQAA
jgi:NADH dehydrogenase (ubiquinone) Fe-S protein 5